MKETKKWLSPRLITVVGALLLLLMMILPFASAEKEYKERLKKYEDKYYVKEIEMTNGEAVNLSLVEFMRVYIHIAGEEGTDSTSGQIGILCVVLISMYGVFALLTLVMALRRKPIGTIVFNLLTMGVLWLIQFDFRDRRMIPSNRYHGGIAYYLAYVVVVAIIVGAVWMFVEKRKLKNRENGEQVEVKQ